MQRKKTGKPETHEISSYALKNLIRDYVIAKRDLDKYHDKLEYMAYKDMSVVEHEEFERTEAIVATSLAWMHAVGIDPGSKYVHDIFREVYSGIMKEEK